MERRHAVYVGLCAATVAFAVTYMIPAVVPVAVPWYYPLEHRWAIEVNPTGLAMDWFGRTLLSAGAGGLAYLVGWGVSRRLTRPLVRGFALWAAWSATAVAFAMALYTWQLLHRTPTPVPLPAWYQPR
jgi:hypothetical protein